MHACAALVVERLCTHGTSKSFAHLDLKESNADVAVHGCVLLFDAGACERLKGGRVTVRSPTGAPDYMKPLVLVCADERE